MKVVLDTSILVRAHSIADGPGREVLGLFRSGAISLLLSPYLLTELSRVLRYPRLMERYAMTEEEITAYLDDLQDLAELVQPTTAKGSILSDAADDPIILTAWAGQADVLCSNDMHFFTPAAKSFATRYGIRILTELQFLDFVRQLRR